MNSTSHALEALPDKMPTGMPGLDYLLEGGLLRGNSMLVEGPPGSGKSTLAVRILYEGIVQYGEPGLIITFEEFPRQIYQESLAYGLDLKALEDAGKLRVVWTSPARILQGFTGKNDLIDKLLTEIGVRRLVIDSITHFKRVSNAEMELREILAGILSNLKLRNVNAFLVKELERLDEATIAFEEYLVDASLRVYNNPSFSHSANTRYIEIRKTRGQGHISGIHPLDFTPKGMSIYPNWRPRDIEGIFKKAGVSGPESEFDTDSSASPSNSNERTRPSSESRSRVKIGVPGLDSMLAEGLWRGSLSIVSGPPGTGKSVLAYHFINQGLLEGEQCMIASLRDYPRQILANAATLGMDWSKAFAGGQLRIIHRHVINLYAEELMCEMIGQMLSCTADRFVFDSIGDLQTSVKSDDRTRDYVHLIAHIFRCCGATSLLIHAGSMSGGAGADGLQEYIGMANTVIQFTMAESDGAIRRFLNVWKHAGSDHAKELREFIIDGAGLRVEQKAAGLSGILTGQTHGAMKQIADQVLPSLEEASALLAGILDRGETGDLNNKLTQMRSNLGLLDILLREHFGETQFRSLAKELEELGTDA